MKITVRVLLDSVSFSRIIAVPLALAARADSSVIISQFQLPVNTFSELFLTVFESLCLKSAFSLVFPAFSVSQHL